MKKLLVTLSLTVILALVLSLAVFATGDKAEAQNNACAGCEVCNPTKVEMDEMPPMEFELDGEAFLESLGYMGKGLVGIFVVTLVIIGVVATLNWHGRSLEKRNQNKD